MIPSRVSTLRSQTKRLVKPPAALLRSRQYAQPEIEEARAAPPVRRRDALYRRVLGAADVLAAAAALTLAIVVLGRDTPTLALLAAAPLIVFMSKVIGLYDRDEHLLQKTTLDEAPALFQLATLYTLLLWLAEDAVLAGGDAHVLGRDQVLGVWGLLFLSMAASRTIGRRLAARLTTPERCLVLGDAAAAEQLQRKLSKSHTPNATVVGRVPFEASTTENGRLPLLGEQSDLARIVHKHEIHRVIIAPRTADSDQLLEAIRLAKQVGAKVSVLPRLFEVVGSSVRFDEIEGLVLLGVPKHGLSRSSKFVKRAVDVVGASLVICMLAVPLALIALTVKLTSPGPVFFRQVRIGRHGSEFKMLKFRTMVDGADSLKGELHPLNEAEGLFKIADDPRLTRVGRFLRRFSLDELPQLFNVLRGDMSLVGPRPLVSEEDQQVAGWERRRLEIPPGMTGVWQILGSARIPLWEMVKLDYLYGANWSLWLDIKILLRTVPYVLSGRGM